MHTYGIMTSPQMYDTLPPSLQSTGVAELMQAKRMISPHTLNPAGLGGHGPQLKKYATEDLSDLDSPEISLDLQNLIEDNQFINEGLFNDFLNQSHLQHQRLRPPLQNARNSLGYGPVPGHPVQFGGESSSSTSGSVSSVKEEPLDDFSNHQALAYPILNGGGGNHSFHALPHTGMKGLHIGGGGQINETPANHLHRKSSSKCMDKNTDEYKKRRERNNIAVRKSREKAKIRSRETEERVKILVRENERLEKRIEMMSEELNVLRSLFTNVGVIPEQLHRELNKHFDQIYPQHHVQYPSTVEKCIEKC